MNNSVSTMTGKIKIKLVFLGDQAVGKSSIIQKYVKDIFDETSNPTVGIDFLVKNVSHKSKNFRLQLWDTAGQQRFRSLIPNYLKDAKCALIVIDVTNKASLVNAQKWLQLYNDNKTVDGITCMVGNKIDLQYRQISKEQAIKKAQQLGVPYYELSAKTGENLQNLFLELINVFLEPEVAFNTNPSPPIKKQQSNKRDQEVIKQEQDNEVQEQKKPVIKQKVGQVPKVESEGKGGAVVLTNAQISKKKNEGNANNGGCCKG